MQQVLVLIVAPVEQFWDSLQVLLRAMPEVSAVQQFAESSQLLAFGSPHAPMLVLLDGAVLARERWGALPQLQARWPQAHTLVLVDDEQQRQAAQVAGAEVVLTKGILAATLLATIYDLLQS